MNIEIWSDDETNQSILTNQEQWLYDFSVGNPEYQIQNKMSVNWKQTNHKQLDLKLNLDSI